MKKGTVLFAVGALIGTICIMIFVDIARLDADYAQMPYSATKSEIQTGYDLGLLPPALFKRRNRNMAVARENFDKAFDKIMHLLGVSNYYKGKIALRPAAKADARVTRSEAVRRMLYALDLLEALGHIRLPAPSTGAANFTDFKVHAGYLRALQFLTSRGVVKGYADGRLHSDKLLTNRDCVVFIVRLYKALDVDIKQRSLRSERTGQKSDETDYRKTVSYRRLMSSHKFDPNRGVDIQEFADKIRKRQQRIREILSLHKAPTRAVCESASKEIKVTSLPPSRAVVRNKSQRKVDNTSLAPAGNACSRFPYLIRKLEETRSLTKVSESDLL